MGVSMIPLGQFDQQKAVSAVNVENTELPLKTPRGIVAKDIPTKPINPNGNIITVR
jgi:hypothetical protein